MGWEQAAPSAPVSFAVNGLLLGRPYLNLFALNPPSPCPPGALEFFGLCFLDPFELFFQIGEPFGTAPFSHFANSGTYTFGPVSLPAGLVIDARSFDLSFGAFCASPLSRLIVQ